MFGGMAWEFIVHPVTCSSGYSLIHELFLAVPPSPPVVTLAEISTLLHRFEGCDSLHLSHSPYVLWTTLMRI